MSGKGPQSSYRPDVAHTLLNTFRPIERACFKCGALTRSRAQAIVACVVEPRGTMLMLLVGQPSRMSWPYTVYLCKADQMLLAETVAHRLLPRSIVVSNGSFQISSLILPVSRLLVTRKLMSWSF